MLVYAFNPSVKEAEADEYEPGFHSKFQPSQLQTVRLCLKKQSQCSTHSRYSIKINSRLRQEDRELGASLGYIVRLSLKETNSAFGLRMELS